MTTYDSALFVFVVFAILMLALPLLWAIELWANSAPRWRSGSRQSKAAYRVFREAQRRRERARKVSK